MILHLWNSKVELEGEELAVNMTACISGARKEILKE